MNKRECYFQVAREKLEEQFRVGRSIDARAARPWRRSLRLCQASRLCSRDSPERLRLPPARSCSSPWSVSGSCSRLGIA